MLEGRELFEWVKFRGFSDDISRHFFKDILKGLQAIHANGFSHRDLKPENILLNQDFVLKVADFGFAKRHEGDLQDGLLHTRVGSKGYQAPEILHPDPATN